MLRKLFIITKKVRTFNLISKMRLNLFAVTSAALVAYGVTAVNLYSTMQEVGEGQNVLDLAQSYQDDYTHDLSQTYLQSFVPSFEDAKKGKEDKKTKKEEVKKAKADGAAVVKQKEEKEAKDKKEDKDAKKKAVAEEATKKKAEIEKKKEENAKEAKKNAEE